MKFFSQNLDLMLVFSWKLATMYIIFVTASILKYAFCFDMYDGILCDVWNYFNNRPEGL